MPNSVFAFKQFTIRQDKCAMKVNTDGVLLGAWVTPNGSKNILEIGTGTGVIALMLAQKSNAKIIAIDIDKESSEQAKLNADESVFNNVEVLHLSFQDLTQSTQQKFDLIVTNPPYFIGSLKTNNHTRTNARHTAVLPFEDIIFGVKKLLTDKGKFCLILPTNEAAIFREMAQHKGLYLSKLLRIRTRSDRDTEKRHLMQFEFKETEFSESTLIIESDRNMTYSTEYKELTKDYYLNF
jgi:tRNA1Val (adenine37-N6)-methyltransferase